MTDLMLQRGSVLSSLDSFFTISKTLRMVLVAEGLGRIFQSSVQELTHSVNSRPGKTALTLTFGPCVEARHFMRWRPAALVTE